MNCSDEIRQASKYLLSNKCRRNYSFLFILGYVHTCVILRFSFQLVTVYLVFSLLAHGRGIFFEYLAEEILVWVFERVLVVLLALQVSNTDHTALSELLGEASHLVVDHSSKDAQDCSQDHELPVVEQVITFQSIRFNLVTTFELRFGRRWNSRCGQVEEFIAVFHHDVLNLGQLDAESS